jgi:hypothetical protein
LYTSGGYIYFPNPSKSVPTVVVVVVVLAAAAVERKRKTTQVCILVAAIYIVWLGLVWLLVVVL